MERTQNFGSEALNSSSHSPTCLYVYPLTQLITTIIIYGESDLNPSCYNGKQSYQHRHQHKFKINLTGHPLKLISSSVPSFHECHYHIHNLSHVRLISPVTYKTAVNSSNVYSTFQIHLYSHCHYPNSGFPLQFVLQNNLLIGFPTSSFFPFYSPQPE